MRRRFGHPVARHQNPLGGIYHVARRNLLLRLRQAQADLLRAANGGKLDGFFDVFAWREPGEVRFDEAKVGRRDSIRPSQRRFVKLALDLHHRL